ncbi:MAG: hypothetical protein FJZ00_03075, partial [Candidatus Sericytochromatia bacterium]|nr:hypothetical protein [Candidatus Tanganyikabacteria bacterium]
KGNPVPVSFRWEESYHAVLVTGVRDGRVHFINPWGTRESCSIADAKRNLRTAAFDDPAGPLNSTNPGTALTIGVEHVVDGVHDLDPIKAAAGLQLAVGGAVTQVTGATGKYSEKAGDAAIGWARDRWHRGNAFEKAAAIPAVSGGAVLKVGGRVVDKASSVASYGLQAAGEAQAWVGEKLQAGIKKVFSGW